MCSRFLLIRRMTILHKSTPNNEVGLCQLFSNCQHSHDKIHSKIWRIIPSRSFCLILRFKQNWDRQLTVSHFARDCLTCTEPFPLLRATPRLGTLSDQRASIQKTETTALIHRPPVFGHIHTIRTPRRASPLLLVRCRRIR